MTNYRFILLVSGLLLTACSNEDFPLREQMKEARQKSDVIAATKNNVNHPPSDQEKNLVQETITDPYENIRHLLEKDAQLNERLTEKNILGIVGLIVGNGYKCDTVSAITPFPRKTGFYVMCNQYHYDYKVEDRGGNWMVTLD